MYVRERLMPMTIVSPSTPATTSAPVPASSAPAVEEREVLVYLSSRQDDSLLGSVYLQNQSIEAAIEDIKKVCHVCVGGMS